MSLKLMYITNSPSMVCIAENSGVNRIWIDLETIGKEIRQKGMNTVKSNHCISDISRVKPHIKSSELMVRINPLHDDSKEEIDSVVNNGVDLIMLPMFHTADDVKKFVEMVSGRAKTILLVETKEAYENLEQIVRIAGIDEIHIGLNDLHLSYGMTFMFEPLANGMVENACSIIRAANIPYGFGGVGRLGEGMLLAEYILGEHYRLGSSMVILSRTFYDENKFKDDINGDIFRNGIKDLRSYEDFLKVQNKDYFEDNKRIVHNEITRIIENILEKRRGQY